MEDSSSSIHDNHHSPEYNYSCGRISSKDGDKWHSSDGYNTLDNNGFGDATAGGYENLSVSLSQNSKPVSDTEDEGNTYIFTTTIVISCERFMKSIIFYLLNIHSSLLEVSTLSVKRSN